MKENPILGITMALSAAVLWGTTGTAQSFAPADLSPYWVGALRLAVAGAFFLALNVRQRRPSSPSAALDTAAWLGIVVAGACMAAYNLTFFAGLGLTGIAVGTSVAIGSGPIWAGLIEAVISRRAPAAAWWAGTILSVGGGTLMVTDNTADYVISLLGIGLCLFSGLSYAGYILTTQRLVLRHAPDRIASFAFVLAACMAVPCAQALSGPLAASTTGLAVVGYLGLAPTGLSYLLYGYALRNISGSTGVTLALAEPVAAFLLAVFVVHQSASVAAWVGLCMVLAGLLLVIRWEMKAQVPTARWISVADPDQSRR